MKFVTSKYLIVFKTWFMKCVCANVVESLGSRELSKLSLQCHPTRFPIISRESLRLNMTTKLNYSRKLLHISFGQQTESSSKPHLTRQCWGVNKLQRIFINNLEPSLKSSKFNALVNIQGWKITSSINHYSNYKLAFETGWICYEKGRCRSLD